MASLLLFALWAQRLPAAGREMVVASIAMRNLHNVALRLFSPLGAAEEDDHDSTTRSAPAMQGAAISMRNVGVRAHGHPILTDVSLEIPAGGHVAIVGRSGAGKSSLVSLLLGFCQPAEGAITLDGALLDPAGVVRLRADTAWVDPAVLLWNRSLIDNLTFGSGEGALPRLPEVMTTADLYELLDAAPEGMASVLGECGARVSGGQGQRIRLGRALSRSDVRLVILDEPFRGLERERRRELLRRARSHWRSATLLFVSHDVSDTRDFDRVLVVDGGQVVEDGAPGQLAADPSSRYHRMMKADGASRDQLWCGDAWRRVSVRDGVVLASPETP